MQTIVAATSFTRGCKYVLKFVKEIELNKIVFNHFFRFHSRFSQINDDALTSPYSVHILIYMNIIKYHFTYSGT